MNCDEESKRAFLLTLSSKYLIDKNKVSMVTQAFFKSQVCIFYVLSYLLRDISFRTIITREK